VSHLTTEAKVMADKLGVLPHIVEAVLNYVLGSRTGVAGVYNRAAYEREIRAALFMWADHVRPNSNRRRRPRRRNHRRSDGGSARSQSRAASPRSGTADLSPQLPRRELADGRERLELRPP
jgi:hypothetical protein